MLLYANVRACEFYLIPHMTILVAGKQRYSLLSEQLDFFQLENSLKFVLLNFLVEFCISGVLTLASTF